MRAKRLIEEAVETKKDLAACKKVHERESCEPCGYFDNCIVLYDYEAALKKLQKHFEKSS